MTFDLLPYLLDRIPATDIFGALIDAFAWLNAHHGLLSGAAAAAAAVIAYLAHQREKHRMEEQEAGADARIAGIAFPVRRTLEKSLEKGWRLDDALPYRTQRAGELQRGFVTHEARIAEMLAEAGRASPEIAAGVRYAARLFWDAADAVNEMQAVDLGHHDAEAPEDVSRDYRKGRDAAEECVEILRGLDRQIREAEPS